MPRLSARPSRRAFLAAAVVAPLAACVAEGPPAPRVPRFRAVRVDAGPFAEKGVSAYAAHVAEVLRPAVAAAFAGRLAPGDVGAPTLVIEVSGVRFATEVNGPAFGGPDAGDTEDEMTGALVLLSASGAVTDRRRHYAAHQAGSAGDWKLPDFDEKRLEALARVYAGWAAREYPA